MNRYSNYEVSAYTPQTAQEIWAVPAAMRQQHNAADEKLQTQIAELDKVNPLDVHYDKAQKIKADLLKQIDAQSSTLASEGFNANTTSGVYKTNRQLKEQFSPTGELGQINAAKTAYDTEKANYLEDATKTSKIGREQALRNWEKYAKSKYTGYSEDGKKITNIGALGTPAYQDYETDRNQYHALLGSVTSSARASGYGIVTDPSTGLMMMVNKGGKIVHSDNIDALNNAIRGMKDKWVSEAGEGRKWADAAGWDPNHTNYRINQDFNAMKSISNVDDRTENYDVLSGQNLNSPTAPTTSIFGEDYNTKEVGGKNQDYSDLEKVGKTFGNTGSVGTPLLMGTDNSGFVKQKSGKFTSDEIKDPRQKMLYENAFKNATDGKTGIILDGKRVQLSEDMKKLGKDDPKVAAQILRSIKQTPAIALTSRLLTTNQILDSQGFVAGLGKEQKTIDTNIRRQLQRDDASGRKLIDPQTHQPISWNEASEKYGLESINDVNYQGQISAHNWEETSFVGSNSKFSPHLVTIKSKDKDGNEKWMSFQTTRLSSDNIGGNIARQNDLQDNFRTATINYNNYVPFKSKSKAFDGMEVMYNPSTTNVDEVTGEPKNWTVKFPGKNPIELTESDYMNKVNMVK